MTAVTVTGYSSFWGGSNQYDLIEKRNPMEKFIATMLRKGSHEEVRELFDSLIGASTGGTALATREQVPHQSVAGQAPAQGGLLTSETKTIINRATIAQDVTDLKAIIANPVAPTYVADLSGNGSQGGL